MNFFRKFECIRSCYLPISSNLLKTKSPLQKLHFLCILRQLLWKNCSISCIFQTIIAIVVTKILEKYLLKSSVLEMKFLESLCKYINLGFKPQILEHLFEEHSNQLCLMLIVSQQIIHNTFQQILTVQCYSEEFK